MINQNCDNAKYRYKSTVTQNCILVTVFSIENKKLEYRIVYTVFYKFSFICIGYQVVQ